MCAVQLFKSAFRLFGVDGIGSRWRKHLKESHPGVFDYPISVYYLKYFLCIKLCFLPNHNNFV